MGSLMLEGTSGVPKSNLLLEAGLLLNSDCLLRALSVWCGLENLQGQEILQPLLAAFSLCLIILVILPPSSPHPYIW